MSMKTTSAATPAAKATEVTVPSAGNNDAAPTGGSASINRTQAQETTMTRELGMVPPAHAAEPAPAAPAKPSIMTAMLEKKQEYESMRQKAIDELLNVMGNAQNTIADTKVQLAELGWEDPDATTEWHRPAGAVRRPGRPRGSTNFKRAVAQRTAAAAPAPGSYKAKPLNKIVPGMEKVVCPACGRRGHDARSHRSENLKAIAKGLREAKR